MLIATSLASNSDYFITNNYFESWAKVKLYITPTNEEIVVAYFVKKVVENGADLKPEEMIFRL